jgi:hypothetical protein
MLAQALSGCGSQDPPSDASPPAAEATLGAEGGAVSLPDGTRIVFPKEALRGATKVRIELAPGAAAAASLAASTRLGEADLAVSIDPPSHVVGRFDLEIAVASTQAAAGTDPAKLFVGYSTLHGDVGEPLHNVFTIAPTQAALEDGSWRLRANLPPPSLTISRFAPHLAEVPVEYFYVFASSPKKSKHEKLFALSVLLPMPNPVFRDRVWEALDKSQDFFAKDGYLVPPYDDKTTGRKDLRAFAPIPITIAEHAKQKDQTPLAAQTPGGKGSITIFTLHLAAQLASNPSLIEHAVAHELYHDHQYWRANFKSMWGNWGDGPKPTSYDTLTNKWVMEGTASLMMDEAYDQVPTQSGMTCLQFTTASLPQKGQASVCGNILGYETHPFFRWLGRPAVNAVFDEAFTNVGPNHDGYADLTALVLARIDPSKGGKRYFDFAASLLYKKDFDVDPNEPLDALGKRADETQPSDLWGECKYGTSTARPSPPATCAMQNLDAFIELKLGTSGEVSKTIALKRLTAYRVDLINDTGKTEELEITVSAKGGSQGILRAAIYKLGDKAEKKGPADLSTPLQYAYSSTPASDGTAVVVVSNDSIQEGADASVEIRLKKKAMCVAQQCQPPCAADQTCCSGFCVNTKPAKPATSGWTAPEDLHCGACGNDCKGDETCVNGGCVKYSGYDDMCSNVTACKPHFNQMAVDCNAIDPMASWVCLDGQCCKKVNSGDCQPTAPPSCGPGKKLARNTNWLKPCAQYCIDPLFEERHCGDSGLSCKKAETCCGGKCLRPEDKDTCGVWETSCVQVAPYKAGTKCSADQQCCPYYDGGFTKMVKYACK